jgi:hypothetical protein
MSGWKVVVAESGWRRMQCALGAIDPARLHERGDLDAGDLRSLRERRSSQIGADAAPIAHAGLMF